MATGTLTNQTKDASGTVVPSLTITITLKPGPGYSLTDAHEITRKLTVTSDTSGSWSVALEQNANISPANSYYEVYEPVPESGGGPITSSVRVASGTQTLYAARITNPQPAPAEGAITQTQGDARYVRTGTPVQTTTANDYNTSTAHQIFGSGKPWYDITSSRFGADPTGATNSRTAIIAAFDAAKATGGIVFVPLGIYRVDTSITFDSTYHGIVVMGCGGYEASATGGSRFLFKGGVGAGSLFIFNAATGIAWTDVKFQYDNTNGAFNGDLMSGVSNFNRVTFDRCQFAGVGVRTAHSLLSTVNGYALSTRRCVMANAVIGIYQSGCNGLVTDDVDFVLNTFTQVLIYNNGSSTGWTISNCVAEALVGNVAAFYDANTANNNWALRIVNNACYDASAGGTWIANYRSLGGCVDDNYLPDQIGVGQIGIGVANGSQAVHIHGNQIGSNIPISFAATCVGASVMGNDCAGHTVNGFVANVTTPKAFLGNNAAVQGSASTSIINPAATTS